MFGQNRSAISAFVASKLALVPAALLLTESSLPAVPDIRGGKLPDLQSLRPPATFESLVHPTPKKLEFQDQVRHCLTNRLADRFLFATKVAESPALTAELRERTAIAYCIISQANPEAAMKFDALDLIFRFDPPLVQLLTLDRSRPEQPLTSDLFVDLGKSGDRRFFVITIPANRTRHQGELTAHIGRQLLTAAKWNGYLELNAQEPEKGLVNGRPPAEVRKQVDEEVAEELGRISASLQKTSKELQRAPGAAGSTDETATRFFSSFAESFKSTIEGFRSAGSESTR